MKVSSVSYKAQPLVTARAEPAWSARPDLFRRIMGSAQAPAVPSRAAHVVREGETLWGICRDALQPAGGGSAAPVEVSAAVERVARANGLANPDMIRAGQELDLSALGKASDPGRSVPALREPGPAPGPNSPRGLTEASAGHRSSATAAGRASGRSAADLARRLDAVLAGETPAAVKSVGDTTEADGAEPWARLLDAPAWVSSPYGTRKDPFSGLRRQHDGVDLAAPAGTRVFAWGEGKVTFSGWKAGYGRTVIVRHENGVETIYGHLSKALPRPGDRVDETTTLGHVGSTGRSTGPHLHFEVRAGGRATDPLELFNDTLSIQIAQVP